MTIQKNNQRTVYLVGGAVRDELLGRSVKERDWVITGASSEELLAEGFYQVGRDFPVFLSPRTKEQYALARTERKAGKGHTGFICHFGNEVTLEEDLERRDLTINAIAKTDRGSLIDPFNGQADLDARILRHVSKAFAEDPLRVFRVARFAAQLAPWGFRVAEETNRLLAEMAASGELTCLTAERVWQETEKALQSPDPSQYFNLLAKWGALDTITGTNVNITKWSSSLGVKALQQTEEKLRATQVYALLFVGLYGAEHQPTKDQLIELKSRLKVPNRYHEIALRTAALFALGPTFNAPDLAQAFSRIDLYRKADHLPAALQVTSLLARTANWTWPPGSIQKAAKASLKISADRLVHRGLTGKELKYQLNAKREAAIAAALNQQHD